MKTILTTIVCLITFVHCSMGQSDSSAYQLQRKKINSLLTERSEKFGHYDQSLTMRTGIFGLKTKKDMQRSIDILTDIVLNDNAVFKELKTLMEYKDYEKSTVETKATQSEDRIGNYMQTITKLQNEQDKLNLEIQSLEKSRTNYKAVVYGLIVISAILAFLLLHRKKLTKD
jgi:hypothetical protein